LTRLRSLVRVALGLLVTLSASQAGPGLDAVRQRGVLRVGTTGDYPPFSYRANAASPFIGLDVELAGRLATTLGVRLELVPTSWPTLLADFAADRFDLAMGGVSVTEERRKVAGFSLTYLRDGKTPIARCADAGRFQTLAQIDQPGVRVIVNPGGTNERFARAHLRAATLVVFPDNVALFDEIVAGRADVMITDAVETRLQQRLRPQLCAIHPEAPFTVSEKAYLLPRDAAFRGAVDTWLQPIVNGPELTKLLDKWLAHPWPRATPGAIDFTPLRTLLAERLALMPDVARHKWNSRSPIEDPAREAAILAGLRREAEALGLPAPWAQQVFRAQIEAAKVIQRGLFARWEATSQERFTDVPDLANVLRPRLDALTGQLLHALAAAWPALSDPAQQPRLSQALQTLRSAPDASAGPAPATGIEAALQSQATAVALAPFLP
jgi:chorismate mutase-like protein